MVEHAAVNRVVVGSSPTSGASLKSPGLGFFSKGRYSGERMSADLPAENGFLR
jgi:hypothetical protein